MAKPELSTEEPDAPGGSLHVDDFEHRSLAWSIRKSISLLPRRSRKWLYVSAAIQVSLGLLDLIGIALIGLVASVAVSGIGLTGIPDWANSLFERIGLGGLTVTQLSAVLAIAAVVTLVFKTLASAALSLWITRFLAAQQANVSTMLARGFLSLPMASVLRWTTSEAVYALGVGVQAATTSLLTSVVTIAAEAFLFLIIGVSLLVYDPILTISAGVFFVVILLVLQRTLSRWTARNAEAMKTSSIDTLTAVNEALLTYRETTVLHRRELYVDRYASLVGRYARAGASNSYLLEIPKYVLEIALYVGVLLLGFIQFLTKDWGAAAATIALYLAAASRITPGLLRLQGATINVRNAGIAAQPTFFMADFLDEHAKAHPRNGSATSVTAQMIHDHVVRGYADFDARVVVDGVSYTFSDAKEPAVRDVSVQVPPGGSVAFVGSTGAGKSTLTDLVLGVLDPDVGSVTIGGLSPRDAIERWPGAITYVPQAVALVAGSVRENVALGMPRELVDDELVWEALRRSHLADFLVDSREGLDTHVGERGFRLSGGQRQRLGIARALYTRPKLLVLDEATSALDAETERAIVQTLDELEGQVTTITVAHRLATVRNCDELIYLKDGCVVGRGTFEEVRSQAKDFDHQASLLGL